MALVVFCTKRYALVLGVAGLSASMLAACDLVMGSLPAPKDAATPGNKGGGSVGTPVSGAAGSKPSKSLDGNAGTEVSTAGHGGTSASNLADAGLDAGAKDAGRRDANVVGAAVDCNGAPPKRFYRDKDQDGYGNSTMERMACVPPQDGDAWVENGKDCDDNEQSIHPGQTEYFHQSYSSVTGVASFDYNCDGSETAAPGQAMAQDCTALLGLGCGGYGFDKTDRMGAGVDPYCGSVVVTTCVARLLGCQAERTTVAVAMDYACN